MTVIIDPEFRSLIPQLTKEEYAGLESSVVAEGCRDALVVWIGKNNILIDGHNRFEICQKHNIKFETKPIAFETRDQAKIWIIKNQFSRRNLQPIQRIDLALILEPLIAGKAKDRKESTQFGAVRETFPQPEKGKTRDELGAIAGVSGKTYEKGKEILSKRPELKEKIVSGEISINKAFTDIKQEEKKAAVQEKIGTSTPPTATGFYSVIYIDPPWKHDNDIKTRSIENQYPVMSIEELSQLHIPAQDNCVMLMWTTTTNLAESIDLLREWGFSYKSSLVWDKEILGMGYWFRNQHELLLLAVKGKRECPIPEYRISSIFREKRGEHSKKPEAFYEIIETMFPGESYIEMFARQKHSDKWDVWGNQA